MAVDFEKTQDVFSDLNLWFKISENRSLTLTDMPELIRLRWAFFRDNWVYLLQKYVDSISTYQDPDRLKADIDSFTEFVMAQRDSKSKKNPFDSSDILYRFYTVFDITPVNIVALSYQERIDIDNKVKKISSFTRTDFLNMRDRLREERDSMADRVDTSDSDYNKIYDRSPQAARVDIKNKDVNKMYEVQKAIRVIDFILANSFSLQTSVVDPFALARANANNSEIDIGQYSSGSLTRLNYGEDLQSLAKRTLGNPDKWIDIAIANGLKAPYIDEIGEKIYLLSNASDNQINIGPSSNGTLNVDKIFIGQTVFIRSDSYNFPEQRSVLNIKQIPVSGEIIIELDGERDLVKYTTADDAYMRIYKPNTVNSSFYVLIPSLEPLNESESAITPWFLRTSDAVNRRQKVDINLNENGDINFNSTGDFQLSYGLDNSIQAIKLKVAIELGELRRHPQFGLPSVPGNTNASVEDVRTLLVNSISNSIQTDPRFDEIDTLNIVYNNSIDKFTPSYFSITLVVRLSGSDNLVPITFTVNA
jgi:hypothetical protein